VAWANRKTRILNVETRLFIINLEYYFNLCENFDLTLVEKSQRVGRVWNHNIHPGIPSDIPSHIYQYRYALKPNWPRFLSSWIFRKHYLSLMGQSREGRSHSNISRKVSDTFDLKNYMQSTRKSQWCSAQRTDFSAWTYAKSKRMAITLIIRKMLRFLWIIRVLSTSISGRRLRVLISFWKKMRAHPVTYLNTTFECFWNLCSSCTPQTWNRNWDQRHGKIRLYAWSEAEHPLQVVPLMQVSIGAATLPFLLTSAQPHVKKIVVFSRPPVWFAPGLSGDAFTPECKHVWVFQWLSVHWLNLNRLNRGARGIETMVQFSSWVMDWSRSRLTWG
jgi:hypothetical protein